ncbi:MAG: hypothetical protein DRJ68_02895 [Thermoprotei archaeon]|nr:MAG: hypothetical protein DRJ68_02895 [Thermoprotei archaeon]
MSIQFYDRERELEMLNGVARSSRAELVIVYGRRRIGKTWLVKRFLELNPGVYLYVEGPSVKRFLSSASKRFGVEFRGLDDFLKHIFESSARERLVVVIDEYQRISRELSPKIQHYWDAYASSSRLKLVLLGSTVGMVERDVSYVGPLYGRATRVLKLTGFGYSSARLMLEGLSEREAVKVYSILGGTPYYLALYDKARDLRSNLYRLFLDLGAPLYDEVERLLTTELREPLRYIEVMEAISAGRRTLKEISDYVKLERTQLKKYMLTLERLGLISRELNAFVKTPPRYRINDFFFRFYTTFITRLKDYIELRQVDYVLEEIMGRLDSYVGLAFQDICLMELSKRLPGYMVASYWDREGNEVDVVAVKGRSALIFECKFGTLTRADAKLLKGKLRLVANKLRLSSAKPYLVTPDVDGELDGVEVLSLRRVVEEGLPP